ncbi:MAG: 16S rRNA (uracil(1498)-N(3))-methyltransferase [Planctomycetes bacterium]|nr:16S rRNA (uracil(1498)-N(3))-methyltransferase [Planctomycetota bacterium]
MNSPRFYVPELSVGQASLSDDQAHHASDVLRLVKGGEVELFDGRGAVGIGSVETPGKKQFIVRVDRLERRIRRGPIVQLGFAIPKGARLDWLLEKATELGAARLEPVIFERSIAGAEELSPHKIDRWTGICVSAAKQCRLDFLPEIRQPARLDDFLKSQAGAFSLTGDLEGTAHEFSTTLARRRPNQPIAILVGPEGDLTAAERAAAIQAGFHSVRLGHTTLRVETAAVAILSAVNAILAD